MSERYTEKPLQLQWSSPPHTHTLHFPVHLLHHKMGHTVFAVQLIHVISNLNESGEQL